MRALTAGVVITLERPNVAMFRGYIVTTFQVNGRIYFAVVVLQRFAVLTF